MHVIRAGPARKAAVIILAALAVALLATIAYAQDAITFDPVAWGSNPGLALTALIGAVAWLRQTPLGKRVDGPILVPLVTAVTGSIGGALLEVTGMLTLDQFAQQPDPWGGVLYGLALTFTAVTGVSLFNYGASKLRPEKQPSVTQWVIDQVKALVPIPKLPAALAAVAPLLAELAQSEAVLTDELRSDLQGRLLTLLRKAGLAGVDL